MHEAATGRDDSKEGQLMRGGTAFMRGGALLLTLAPALLACSGNDGADRAAVTPPVITCEQGEQASRTLPIPASTPATAGGKPVTIEMSYYPFRDGVCAWVDTRQLPDDWTVRTLDITTNPAAGTTTDPAAGPAAEPAAEPAAGGEGDGADGESLADRRVVLDEHTYTYVPGKDGCLHATVAVEATHHGTLEYWSTTAALTC